MEWAVYTRELQNGKRRIVIIAYTSNANLANILATALNKEYRHYDYAYATTKNLKATTKNLKAFGAKDRMF